MSNDLAALAGLCGILPSYFDLQGHARETSPETQKALVSANGVDVSNPAAIRDNLARLRHTIEDRWFPEEVIVRSQTATPLNFGLGAAWQLSLDGQEEIVAEAAPADHITLPPLPSGIYVLTATTPQRTEIITVLAAPHRVPSVEDLTGRDRLWGLNCALYGLQSGRNGGLGDFSDLAQMAEIAAGQGASFVGINPLHNMGFCDLDAISPYSPSHRGFLNTAYIALDGVSGLDGGYEGAAFRSARAAGTVQYGDHKRAHNAALKTIYGAFKASAPKATQIDFANFVASRGSPLQEFARFEALSETHGRDWRIWPAQTGKVAALDLEFHIWLQWVAARQLEAAQTRANAAGMSLGLYLDLAVGPRRDGAESWCERAAIATGVSIGAPPDHLSPEGQNWDLAAFAPRKLKAQRYAPLRRILAQTMRYAGVIRIDHVLGLNRSFWIPDDGSPGAYIYQPFEALLAVIKIEAERHNCAVIGEDLGLVPDGFRDTMRDSGFYGYSVLQYEKDDTGALRDPGQLPAQVLACFATHDTPTITGYEAGRDIDWWLELNWIEGWQARDMHAQRAREVAGFKGAQTFQPAVHASVAHSGAGLVAIQLDDVLCAVEAQNLPGTIDQHPNWRRKYQSTLSDLATDPRMDELGALMKEAGRA